jgi:hypothetical protein
MEVSFAMTPAQIALRGRKRVTIVGVMEPSSGTRV